MVALNDVAKYIVNWTRSPAAGTEAWMRHFYLPAAHRESSLTSDGDISYAEWEAAVELLVDLGVMYEVDRAEFTDDEDGRTFRLVEDAEANTP